MAEQYCTRMLDFCYQFSHCSPQKKFLLCFLCFKLCIFSRGDSSKSFSYPRVNEGLYATSQRQEDVELQKRGELGRGWGKERWYCFFSSPSPLFSLFRPSDNPWIAISTLPDLHLSKKKIKMADNSLLTKDTWPIAWACALEVDRRMPGDSGSGTCHTAPVDVDSRLFCTCCTCRGKTWQNIQVML